jgi:hypothetical protein
MPPSGPPTEQGIRKIARRTTNIIRSSIIANVCLFGSAASSLWADIGRVPNVSRTTQLYLSLLDINGLYSKTQDIDSLVSEDSDDDGWELDPEEIKETIVDVDDRYCLKRSRQRGATHQILYCRLPGWKTDHRLRVKVDILVPPTLGLPEISDMNAILINDISVMPIFDLLEMKMQGWWDHRTSHRSDFHAKESNDILDIFALLERAREKGVSYNSEAYEYRHSQEFTDRARTLVKRFVRVYGEHWK